MARDGFGDGVKEPLDRTARRRLVLAAPAVSLTARVLSFAFSLACSFPVLLVAVQAGFSRGVGAERHCQPQVFLLLAGLERVGLPFAHDLGFPRGVFTFDPAARWSTLQPFVAGSIDTNLITTHWDDVPRLVTSIRTGVVSASLILKRLSAYRPMQLRPTELLAAAA